MLNTTTNLKFKLKAKTYRTTVVVTGAAVPQEMSIPKAKKLTAADVTAATSAGVTTPVNNIITVNNTTSVSSSVADSGTSSELTTYTLSSIAPYNKDVTIATIVIRTTEAASYKIPTQPSVSIDSVLEGSSLSENVSLRLDLTDTVEDSNNNVTSWTFNLVYRGSIKINDINGLVFDLNHVTQTIPSSTLEIKHLIFSGDTIINSNGELKKFNIYGVPTTEFELSFLNSSGENILSSGISSAEAEGMQPVLTASIPTSGVYSFNQSFPKIPLIRKTAINGSMAASGATKIIFDSLTDVQVGDQLFMSEIPYSSVITVVTLNPDTDNVNECTLSDTVTAADNAVASFRRSTTYDLHLTSSSSVRSTVPTTIPTYTFNQYRDPLLTFKLSTDRTDYAINSGSAGAEYEIRYPGKVNVNSSSTLMPTYVKKRIAFTHTLDGVGSKSLTLSRQPLFSDWTNTDSSSNGGTNISMSGLKAVLSTSGDGHSNGICTITGVIHILRWGTEDVTMELDLDDFVS